MAEVTTFDAQVSARDGRPFVKMTCELDGRPVWATQMKPSVAVALGLRAIQSAIEAERDAGLIAYVLEEFAPRILGPESDADDAKRLVALMLDGLRTHRQQFDPEEGSMRRLGPDDPSELI